MLRKFAAVAAAAAIAALVVGFIPTPRPAAADKAPQAAVVEADKPAVIVAATATCTQGWPHYDQSCLRDSRRPSGNAHVARIISMDRSVADRALRARR